MQGRDGKRECVRERGKMSEGWGNEREGARVARRRAGRESVTELKVRGRERSASERVRAREQGHRILRREQRKMVSFVELAIQKPWERERQKVERKCA